jgi:hypothetical protein
MSVSDQTIGLIAKEFFDGGGFSGSRIDNVWIVAGVGKYLPTGPSNKLTKVQTGLTNLRDGCTQDGKDLGPQKEKLRTVIKEIATELEIDLDGNSRLAKALTKDGFASDGSGEVIGAKKDTPATRLAEYLDELFQGDERFDVARNHYMQANAAFDNRHWESANAQFRSAFEATFNVLAHANGCPPNKNGGVARKWLQGNDLLDKGEADLIQSFGSFASDAGSHAGLSDQGECQLRRHFVTALMVYGIKKLSEVPS